MRCYLPCLIATFLATLAVLAGPQAGNSQVTFSDVAHGMAFSPDGRTLAVSRGGTGVELWDVRTQRKTSVIPAPGRCPWPVLFLDNGRTLVFGQYDGTVVFWDMAHERQKASFALHHGQVVGLAASPDGKVLASYRFDRVVKVWEAATGKERFAVRGFPRAGVPSRPGRPALEDWPSGGLAIAPDGKTLAIHGCDTSVRLWDLASGKAKAILWSPGARGGRAQLAYSPDGRTIACGAADGKVWLWEVASGGLRAAWPAHDRVLTALAFTPDGRTLVTAGYDSKVRLWDVVLGKQRTALNGGEPALTTVAVSPDGTTVAAGGSKPRVRFWNVQRWAGVRPQGRKLSDKELDQCWRALSSEDAGAAYRALGLLANAPGQTEPFLRTHLRPVRADMRLVRRWVRELDDDDFEVRQRAYNALTNVEGVAATALREALAHEPSPELRHRAQALLSLIANTELRTVRTVEVLEYLGTPAAKGMLQTLARGAPHASSTAQAQAALRRLEALAKTNKGVGRSPSSADLRVKAGLVR